MIQTNYSRAAENVLISLDQREREDALNLISLATDYLQKGTLFNGISKLDIPGKDIFSIRLSEQLRIIIERTGTEIKVIDIINYGLKANYA